MHFAWPKFFLAFAFLAASCSTPSSSISQLSPTLTPSPLPQSVAISTATNIVGICNSALSVAEIEFVSLGPNSQLNSPISLVACLRAGFDNKVRIELFKDDGTLLVRRIVLVDSSSESVELQESIDFEISQASTSAYLILSTEDEYGRLQTLNSIDVTLLKEVPAQIHPSANLGEAIVIEQPEDGQTLEGGNIVISGRAYSQPGRALTIKLITRAGKVLAFGEVYPIFAQDSEYGIFEAEFNIELDEAEWIQIAISESAGAIPRPIHFKAIEVLFTP